MKKKYSLINSLRRNIRMKLIVPLLRSPHPPEYKARGVAVGLAWAMTPLVGIQMWLVFMTWLFFKKVLKKSFSLPLGIAWTWVTNVITMIPCYYIFYVTGQILRWNVDNITGYQALSGILHDTFMGDLSFCEQWILFFKLLLKDWGVSMAIGCLPFMVLVSFLGYRITMRFELARLTRKKRKELINKNGEDYETEQ